MNFTMELPEDISMLSRRSGEMCRDVLWRPLLWSVIALGRYRKHNCAGCLVSKAGLKCMLF